MKVEDYLTEVEAREKAATGGPWKSIDDAHDYWGMVETEGPKIKVVGFTIATDVSAGQGRKTRADRDFITASRQDIPRLLRIVKRLRKDIACQYGIEEGMGPPTDPETSNCCFCNYQKCEEDCLWQHFKKAIEYTGKE